MAWLIKHENLRIDAKSTWKTLTRKILLQAQLEAIQPVSLTHVGHCVCVPVSLAHVGLCVCVPVRLMHVGLCVCVPGMLAFVCASLSV